MALIPNTGRRASRHSEDGYVLLTLLLMMALMVIFAAVILPTITFEIKRDREEEMIHRGVQYSRAIRAYYKKFNRYPTKIEDLESANNQRFLRKRYKDPITGQDFKLLHFGEVKLTFSGGIGGGTIPGANAVGGANPGLIPATLGGNSTFGANSSPTPGQNQRLANSLDSDTDPAQPASTTQSDSAKSDSASSDKLAGQTFGGGPIVGVASGSKGPTIREFNHKKKYNEWQFIYDPATDRGGLLMTPNQPPLQGVGQQTNPNANGLSGQNDNALGNTGTGAPPPGMLNGPPQVPQQPPQQ